MDPVPESKVLDLGSLVLFARDADRTAAFYRALGLPLDPERHGDGPIHHTCSLGATHVAIFAARSEADLDAAPSATTPAGDHRAAGAQFFGLTVARLETAYEAALEQGAPVVQEPKRYSWGRRALVRDPDGRVVELFERPSRETE